MPDHYFSAEPASAEQLRRIDVELAGRALSLWTAAGVFSPDHLDTGTAVLLAEAPNPPADGTFLDLGCGWGPLALALGLLRGEGDIWGVDVNERALDLARRNAESIGIPARFVVPDAVPADLRFDLIWSNPPIRVGKTVLHHVLRTWLPRLSDGGEAYLVVQKNLGADSLERWISAELAPLRASRYASRKGFRVLRVART